MSDPTGPTLLDWIMLRRDEVKAVLAAHGLNNARVVCWAGAAKDLGGPAEIQVDLPEITDLTSGDLARLDHELSELVGVELVVWPCGQARLRCCPARRSGTCSHA